MAYGQPERQTLLSVSLPAREIAPPATISPTARAQLAAAAANPPNRRPAPGDLAGWREAVAASEAMWRPLAQAMLDAAVARVEDVEIAGVPCYVAGPAAEQGGPIYLYFHGGAFVFGGGLFARAHGAANADRLGCTVVSVDYRMPPDHPFPAAPDDGVAVYRALIERHDPSRIVIGGSSAGGNIAAAVTLMIRDAGLPLPGAVVLLTPEVDLTEAGDSFRTNELLDVVLKRGLPECNALYAAGRDLTDPYLSPLFADFAVGFPPTLVQTGTRDLFLSNSALIHRKLRAAGIPAELHVWEAMPHGGFGGGAPEDQEVFAEVRAFIDRHTAHRGG
jgi:acetyl esterase/lipase